jgi:hypothetical protein
MKKIPKKDKRGALFGIWALEIGIYLGFGFWDLGFPGTGLGFPGTGFGFSR